MTSITWFCSSFESSSNSDQATTDSRVIKHIIQYNYAIYSTSAGDGTTSLCTNLHIYIAFEAYLISAPEEDLCFT